MCHVRCERVRIPDDPLLLARNVQQTKAYMQHWNEFDNTQYRWLLFCTLVIESMSNGNSLALFSIGLFNCHLDNGNYIHPIDEVSNYRAMPFGMRNVLYLLPTYAHNTMACVSIGPSGDLTAERKRVRHVLYLCIYVHLRWWTLNWNKLYLCLCNTLPMHIICLHFSQDCTIAHSRSHWVNSTRRRTSSSLYGLFSLSLSLLATHTNQSSE